MSRSIRIAQTSKVIKLSGFHCNCGNVQIIFWAPDSLGPVVSPLNHGARFEIVASHFVDVVLPILALIPQGDLRPVARKKSTPYKL